MLSCRSHAVQRASRSFTMRRVRVAAVVLGLAGCNWAFGLEATRNGIPLPPGCAAHLFAAPQPLPNITGAVTAPALVGHNELFYVRRDSGSGEIYRTARASSDVDFPDGAPVTELNTPGDERDLGFDYTGLDLLFVRDERLLEATRPTPSDPFSLPIELPELSTESAYNGLALSYDDLTVYYSDAGGNLHSATRPAADQPFATPVMLLPSFTYPSISPDGLELYGLESGDRMIHRLTRATVADPFGNDTILFPGDDPYVSSDAATLVFQLSYNAYTAQRVCQ